DEDHVEGPATLLDSRGPGRAAAGVAGGERRGQGHVAEADLLSVPDVLVRRDRLEGIVVAVREVAQPAPVHLRPVRLAGQDARSGPALDLGESSAVVEVSVAVEDQLHVSEVE